MKLHLESRHPFTAHDVSFVSAESAIAASSMNDMNADKLKVILSLENDSGKVADFALTLDDAKEMCLEVLKVLTGEKVGGCHEGFE